MTSLKLVLYYNMKYTKHDRLIEALIVCGYITNLMQEYDCYMYVSIILMNKESKCNI